MRAMAVLTILSALALGCTPDEAELTNGGAHSTTGADAALGADPFPNCPLAEQVMHRADWEQAKGTYRAEQSGKAIMIHASGEHPRAGYETKLAMNLTKIYPPQFTLLAKPPAGPSATVMTPFETCVKVSVDGPVKTLVVFDATGRHEVDVEQAKQ